MIKSYHEVDDEFEGEIEQPNDCPEEPEEPPEGGTLPTPDLSTTPPPLQDIEQPNRDPKSGEPLPRNPAPVKLA